MGGSFAEYGTFATESGVAPMGYFANVGNYADDGDYT
jgi:hypothetical protein